MRFYEPFFAAFFVLFLISEFAPSFAAETPNIIYILADDLGYAELGCYGQQKIRWSPW